MISQTRSRNSICECMLAFELSERCAVNQVEGKAGNKSFFSLLNFTLMSMTFQTMSAVFPTMRQRNCCSAILEMKALVGSHQESALANIMTRFVQTNKCDYLETLET